MKNTSEHVAWFLCVPPNHRSFVRRSVSSEIYQLLWISFCHKSSSKGRNLLEVHESWHRVLWWICWHCCGLLCKYTSVDFIRHKLCKCPFRDSSKCRLLARCLETINIWLERVLRDCYATGYGCLDLANLILHAGSTLVWWTFAVKVNGVVIYSSHLSPTPSVLRDPSAHYCSSSGMRLCTWITREFLFN